MSALLTATDLVLNYGTTSALKGANLSVDEGEILAVMGPSGSGKSTLLHCAAGILQPSSGSVWLGDVELSSLSDRERSELRREEFGFVFQFGQLISELTCLQNVALPLRLAGMKRDPAEKVALDWMDRLDVASTARQRPGEVSGGQAQRVAVDGR